MLLETLYKFVFLLQLPLQFFYFPISWIFLWFLIHIFLELQINLPHLERKCFIVWLVAGVYFKRCSCTFQRLSFLISLGRTFFGKRAYSVVAERTFRLLESSFSQLFSVYRLSHFVLIHVSMRNLNLVQSIETAQTVL